jgi:hypothetical protein
VPAIRTELVTRARPTSRSRGQAVQLLGGLAWLGAWLGHAAPTLADTALSGGSVIVTASESETGLADAQLRAEALQNALRRHRANVLEPEEARAIFEAAHSREPVTLGAEEIAALRERVREATRLLALGKLREAMATTEPLRRLADRALDNMKRDLGEAQELFDICVVSATLMASQGERRAAERHMQQCVHGFPGLKTALDYHSPAARELFAKVAEQVQPGSPANLVIRTARGDDCITRVNGIPTGPPPAALELAPTQVRVQLECGGRIARVHPVSLESGFNEVTIDPDFDSVVRSDAPRLRLRYERAAALESKATLDALAIGRAIRAEAIFLVQVVRGTTTLRRLAANGARGPQIRWDAALADARALSEVSATVLAPTPPKAWRSPDRQPAVYQTALPALHLDADNAWLVPTAIVVGYSLGLGSSLFALARRSEIREDALSDSIDIDGYRQAHTLGLIGAITGSTLATSAELFGLPRRPGVPWWAWLVGGAGVATLGAAVALAPEQACTLENRLRTCTQWTEDEIFQPLLVIQSIPLLAVPLTYAISSALGEDSFAAVHADGRSALLIVRGAF